MPNNFSQQGPEQWKEYGIKNPRNTDQHSGSKDTLEGDSKDLENQGTIESLGSPKYIDERGSEKEFGNVIENVELEGTRLYVEVNYGEWESQIQGVKEKFGIYSEEARRIEVMTNFFTNLDGVLARTDSKYRGMDWNPDPRDREAFTEFKERGIQFGFLYTDKDEKMCIGELRLEGSETLGYAKTKQWLYEFMELYSYHLK